MPLREFTTEEMVHEISEYALALEPNLYEYITELNKPFPNMDTEEYQRANKKCALVSRQVDIHIKSRYVYLGHDIEREVQYIRDEWLKRFMDAQRMLRNLNNETY